METAFSLAAQRAGLSILSVAGADPAGARIAMPNFRRNKTYAASLASWAPFHSQAPAVRRSEESPHFQQFSQCPKAPGFAAAEAAAITPADLVLETSAGTDLLAISLPNWPARASRSMKSPTRVLTSRAPVPRRHLAAAETLSLWEGVTDDLDAGAVHPVFDCAARQARE